MDVEHEVNSLNGRMATIEHAMFGFDDGDGVIAEVRGLRVDIVRIAAEAKDGLQSVYRLMLAIAGASLLAFLVDLLTRTH